MMIFNKSKQNNLVLPAPFRLYLTITNECNLRCRQCDNWRRKDNRAQKITLAEKIEILKQFKEINPAGIVCFWGGEPLLNPEEFFQLSLFCKKNAITDFVFTNGTLISTPALAEQLLQQGPALVIFSLDGAAESTHDQIRGQKGAYRKLINGLQLLLAARKRHPEIKNYRVAIACTLMEENYREMFDYIDLGRQLGVDHVFFQPAVGLEDYSPKDTIAFQGIIDEIMQKYYQDPFIVNNIVDFFYLKEYHNKKYYLSADHSCCDSANKNIYVDIYGNVSLCAISLPVGNIREDNISDIWFGSRAKEQRDVLEQCRLRCGMLSNNNKNSS